eukprot:TRINITY_DN5207_c0_g1_i1.p1 TRINITY_DN5207_c0_g1~~TRINITY_DN5207_c0_g1_i1.p1  ORF type:complete len:205 (-),score=40.51 TRINITY_DN5207_c0_g1_i1:299-913(-)
MARVWLGGLGFTLMFSAILAKNFRVWKIFASLESLKAVDMPNSFLAKFVVVACLVELVVLLVWQLYAPLTDSLSQSSMVGEDEVEVICDSDSTPILIAYFVLKGVLVLLSCIMAVMVRRIEDQFNESKIIAFNVYNFLVFGLFVVFFVSFSKLSVTAKFLIPTLCILTAFNCVLVSFFGYKMVPAAESKSSNVTVTLTQSSKIV